MRIRRLPAVFMRGGTSKAILFRAEDLPADRSAWDAIFCAAIGSPDPHGRQLDGMGGGLSSLSKICVIGPPSRADADVDYSFVQMGIGEAVADTAGNCGNMSAAVGPYAVEEGLVAAPRDGEAVVRIHNTNTGKIIVSRFPVEEGRLAADGDFVLDGVAGTAAPIRLEFLDPGGAKTGRLLPTGRPVDLLEIEGRAPVAATCIDAGNPAVFVAAADLGCTGIQIPDDIDADWSLRGIMEKLRLAGSVAMGIAPDLAAAARIPSIPKIAMVSPPQDAPTLSGRTLAAADMDIAVRMISVGQAHRAVPITGAIGLAVAARVPGTIPHKLCRAGEGPIRIAHASGTILVDAAVRDGHADHGAVFRSARRLFEGAVLYRAE